ncbi:MAG TPA: hypothetical protein DE045_09110, partial [Oceanospirillaceae bacterium]|nr:hypothetical protein [Oceanospirillaceae bacterium]
FPRTLVDEGQDLMNPAKIPACAGMTESNAGMTRRPRHPDEGQDLRNLAKIPACAGMTESNVGMTRRPRHPDH